ncbi:tRNA (adenosine(37)-N6)-threonylcarbamoyltransferase complex ATPase subunit type 1 TsaE [Spiroplasma endosymbiont of Anurida maritima]|uniref:tRNA (adenosine(37)-N6)-threonylcarbamoyltransferase complex ATPase subunit type 1 TsaE n=1 Tax=Spiroplasma endosymbiont of Anurida maritima TaxID=2967972 RepID=UPI0036D3E33C
MQFKVKNINNYEDIFSFLKPVLRKNIVFLLSGDLGAGKTTLVGYLLKNLGLNQVVNSPSFSIHNNYNIKGLTINHFDFYRLDKTMIDWEYYLYEMENSLNFIEWKHKDIDLNNFKPLKIITIDISVLDEEQRIINIEGV